MVAEEKRRKRLIPKKTIPATAAAVKVRERISWMLERR